MDNKHNLAFKKINYILMLIGILLLAFGFIIMASDTETHGFGFAGLTLGPIVVLSGLVLEIFAIMYHPKSKA
jgi:hypothetical protein